MRFGRTLRKSVYAPWQDKYIDYDKLKKLLKEDSSDKGSLSGSNEEDWSQDDEEAFVEELVNIQLEKVHAFQSEALQRLRDRLSKCETRLDQVAKSTKQEGDGQDGGEISDVDHGEKQEVLKAVEAELDSITKEMNELEKYSRINYTGFLKAAKKHDRKRGNEYRVRPILQVRLAALPFNQEDYSPLLYRISTIYNYIREHLSDAKRGSSLSEASHAPFSEQFRSYKCKSASPNCAHYVTLCSLGTS